MRYEYVSIIGIVSILIMSSTIQQGHTQVIETNSTQNYMSNSSITLSNTTFTSYKDEDIGFQINYPENWEATTSDLHHNAIVAFSPEDKQVEVDIYLLGKEKGETLKTYGNDYKQDENFRISAFYRNSSTTLGGLPALKIIGTFFTSPNIYDQAQGYQSKTYKILLLATLINDKDFLEVRYWADKSNYNDFLPIVGNMINSFQIHNKKPIIQEEN